ncbi:MAG: STAS domain-containing protein [Chloroflexota bacterium]
MKDRFRGPVLAGPEVRGQAAADAPLHAAGAADTHPEGGRAGRGRPAAGAGTGLVLDGSALAYVSSAGLRVFLTIAKEAKAANVRVAVGALQPAVKQVFDISGFSQTKIIDVHPTVDAAVSAVAG